MKTHKSDVQKNIHFTYQTLQLVIKVIRSALKTYNNTKLVGLLIHLAFCTDDKLFQTFSV